MDTIGPSATFALLTLTTVLALWWTRANVPETKGRSLEEIEALFAGGATPGDVPPGDRAT